MRLRRAAGMSKERGGNSPPRNANERPDCGSGKRGAIRVIQRTGGKRVKMRSQRMRGRAWMRLRRAAGMSKKREIEIDVSGTIQL